MWFHTSRCGRWKRSLDHGSEPEWTSFCTRWPSKKESRSRRSWKSQFAVFLQSFQPSQLKVILGGEKKIGAIVAQKLNKKWGGVRLMQFEAPVERNNAKPNWQPCEVVEATCWSNRVRRFWHTVVLEWSSERESWLWATGFKTSCDFWVRWAGRNS